MKKFVIFFSLLTAFQSLQAMGRAQAQVEIADDNNYGWHGPGYYYGYWFDDEDDYIAWRQGGYDDDNDGSTEIWIGPGWYGGYWYGDEGEWNRHSHNDHWNSGHGGGGHGGGGHGGGGHGGGGHGHH